MKTIKRLIKNILGRRRKRIDRKTLLNSHHQVVSYDIRKEFDYRKQGFSYYESVLFNLSKNDQKNYISTWEAYQPRYLPNKYYVISDDKYLFSIVFGKFIETPISYGLINNGVITPLVEELTGKHLLDFIIEKKVR